MGKRIIDLSLDVVPAQSWVQFPRNLLYGKEEPPTRIQTVMDRRSEGGGFCQRIETTTQSFTHIDAPSHIFKDGVTNEKVPLEHLMGEAAVIDMMHKKEGETVTAADLEKSGVKVKQGDIALIRTGWTDRAWGTEKFWADMICLSLDAGDWLVDKGIKALAQDFFTDIRALQRCGHCGSLIKTEYSQAQKDGKLNHQKLLSRGIILMEWLTNLGAIRKPRVTLICLPQKIVGSDGAQARIIAIEED